jgi:hypothetical protein
MFQGAYQSFNFNPIPSPTHLQAEKVRGTGARYFASVKLATSLINSRGNLDRRRGQICLLIPLLLIRSWPAESLNLAASEVEELQRVRGLPTLQRLQELTQELPHFSRFLNINGVRLASRELDKLPP